MAFNLVLWMLISISFFSLCLPFAWAIYYNITRTHIPSGISQPVKLWLTSLCVNVLVGVAVFLERVGICNRYTLWRHGYKGIPSIPMMNSELIIKDLLFDNVNVRMYCPNTASAGNRRGMLYIPGGVGLIGSVQSYDRICRVIAKESNTVVVSVGFRLAPEHPYPTQILECCTATLHFLKKAEEYNIDPNRIIIGGDSSGATFAALVCQMLVTMKDVPRLRAQILLYPYLQMLDFNLPSYQQNHSIPLLFKKRCIKLGMSYLTGKHENVDGIMNNAHVPEELRVKYRKWISADHIPDKFKVRGYVPVEPAPFSQELYELLKEGLKPGFSPLLAEDDVICQLPETFLLTCEYDILRDDGLLYKKRLQDNSVPVTWRHIEDGFHGIMFSLDCGALEFPNGRRSLQYIVSFLERL